MSGSYLDGCWGVKCLSGCRGASAAAVGFTLLHHAEREILRPCRIELSRLGAERPLVQHSVLHYMMLCSHRYQLCNDGACKHSASSIAGGAL